MSGPTAHGERAGHGGGPGRQGPSRRAVIVGGALVLAGGAGAAVAVASLGDDAVAPPTAAPEPPPVTAPAPTPGTTGESLRVVLAEAEVTAGMRLLGSPWARWAGRPDGADGEVASGWDGLYVSWLLRRHGADPAATAPTDLLALVSEHGKVGVAPAPGALVFYDRELGEGASGEEPARVGIVTSVTGAALAQTLEGDHPAALPHAERFVRRLARPGPGPLVFAMPAYAPDETTRAGTTPDEPREDR